MYSIRNGDNTTAVNNCPMCGMENIVELPTEQYEAWVNGAHIQNVAPQLTPEQREILISGICPKCWDKIWKGYDE